MPNFVIGTPEDVARSGSNKSWTAVTDVLDPVLYASAGTFLPGSSADYIILPIEAPSPPLGSLPSFVTLTLNGYETTVTPPSVWVVDDTISWYVAGGPVGSNAAQNLPFGSVASQRTWNISTAGISGLLANINAGTAAIVLGFSSPGNSTTFESSNWSLSYSGVGSQNENGVVTAWSTPPPYTVNIIEPSTTSATAGQSGQVSAHATWIGGGAAPPYVPLDVSNPMTAGAQETGGGGTNYQTVTDVFGNTKSSTNSAITLRNSGYEIGVVTSSVGTWTGTVYAYSTVATTSLTELSALAAVQFTAAVVQPTPTEIYLNQASLKYMGASDGSGTGGGVPGKSFYFSPRITIFPPEAATTL